VIYNAHLEAIHDLLGPSENSTSDTNSNNNNEGDNQRKTKHQDFTYFRLGETDTTPHQQLSAVAAERANIATKLVAMQLARRKAKEERRATQNNRPSSSAGFNNGPSSNGTDTAPESAEPIIRWHHLVKSLDTTRASLSAQEHRRLFNIYREFTVGRNGEMSDGQGSNEVGGRTSLM
jgi:peroxin-1